jgi:hypothetical protein
VLLSLHGSLSVPKYQLLPTSNNACILQVSNS